MICSIINILSLHYLDSIVSCFDNDFMVFSSGNISIMLDEKGVKDYVNIRVKGEVNNAQSRTKKETGQEEK